MNSVLCSAEQSMRSTNPPFPIETMNFYGDRFLKHLSQGFAEVAQGKAYLVVKDGVTPDNVNWDADKAWGGKS